MDIIKQRTNELYNNIKDRIQQGKLKTVDEVADAIWKGADERCLTFGEHKNAAIFEMVGHIDSESLYLMVEEKV